MRKVILVCMAALAAREGARAQAADNEFLEMDITQLMNVTVTSVSKREQQLSDAAAAEFIISQEDIRRSGVTTIPDALAMAPGIQVGTGNQEPLTTAVLSGRGPRVGQRILRRLVRRSRKATRKWPSCNG